MMTPISKIFRRKEAGFLLTEVLIALIIVSIVAIGASVMVVQLMSVKSTNANNVTVTSNINSATDSLVPDVQMAEINVNLSEEEGEPDVIAGIGQAAEGKTKWVRATDPETGDEIITGMGAEEGETEWLWLEWEWNDGKHRVTYRIEDGSLYRIHTIDGSLEGRTLVAKYIDVSQSNWQLVIQEQDEETGEPAKLIVEITVSASTGGYKSASESRTIQVTPRITS